MVKSMTGYGISKGSNQGLNITFEVKSVNNRYLDTSIRLPRNFLFVEDSIKALIQKHISRGKVDAFVTIDYQNSDDTEVTVNESLLKSYIECLRHISEEYAIPSDFSAISVARIPDVLTVTKKELDQEALKNGVLELAEKALCDFDNMRCREGSKLNDDVLSRLETINGYIDFVEKESANTVIEYRNRLEIKMKELLSSATIDESRIIAETAIFADHIATDEETVRLRSHISQMKDMLSSNAAVGKKLDFLVQEFNREANTICSKCQNSQITHVAVELKSEIEKIREQIQNIE